MIEVANLDATRFGKAKASVVNGSLNALSADGRDALDVEYGQRHDAQL